jgi:hypothetical protein
MYIILLAPPPPPSIHAEQLGVLEVFASMEAPFRREVLNTGAQVV